MKKGDEVFFFTLVDLFAQVMFFGLVLFAVSKAKDRDALPVGISNITELTDSLSRLTAQVARARALEDSITTLVGKLVDSTAVLAAQVRAQYGLPPCNGREEYIATIVLTDDLIELSEVSPTMDSLIRQVLRSTPAQVRSLSPQAFIAAFRPVAQRYPDCRYFVRVRRQNRLEAPALAVYTAFRTELRRAPR